jgi:hypothetical protein
VTDAERLRGWNMQQTSDLPDITMGEDKTNSEKIYQFYITTSYNLKAIKPEQSS